VTNLIRHPDFIDYIILGRYEQPLTLAFRGRKLVVQIIPFENRRQILVTHDATETERIEAMRRDFIANASHELRTPLTVIVGFLEIAMADPGMDEATRVAHLKLMTEQAQRMQRLIEDMLTLSRLESSEYPLKRERVDVHALVEQVALDARALSNGRHEIEFSVDGPDVMGSTGRTAQRLRQPGHERGALHAGGRAHPAVVDAHARRTCASRWRTPASASTSSTSRA
jgi:two-component system phosphate regulon sensor histidine kinase PhoR